jgi:hypothetical protein
LVVLQYYDISLWQWLRLLVMDEAVVLREEGLSVLSSDEEVLADR